MNVIGLGLVLLPWFGYLGELSNEAHNVATKSFGSNWAIIFIVARAARNLHGSTRESSAKVMRLAVWAAGIDTDHIAALRPDDGVPYSPHGSEYMGGGRGCMSYGGADGGWGRVYVCVVCCVCVCVCVCWCRHEANVGRTGRGDAVMYTLA